VERIGLRKASSGQPSKISRDPRETARATPQLVGVCRSLHSDEVELAESSDVTRNRRLFASGFMLDDAQGKALQEQLVYGFGRFRLSANRASALHLEELYHTIFVPKR
jgi:hypothetical protein